MTETNRVSGKRKTLTRTEPQPSTTNTTQPDDMAVDTLEHKHTKDTTTPGNTEDIEKMKEQLVSDCEPEQSKTSQEQSISKRVKAHATIAHKTCAENGHGGE